MTPEYNPADDPKLRQSVGESFNIFQATMAMVAIFMGFVFAGLLQLLTSADDLNTPKTVVVWLLTVAMLSLSLAILCFHATAHRAVRYWRIFYPVSIYNFIGGLAFSGGLLTMLWSVAALLWNKNMIAAAWTVAISAVALIGFGFSFRRMHGIASYMVKVDELPNAENNLSEASSLPIGDTPNKSLDVRAKQQLS